MLQISFKAIYPYKREFVKDNRRFVFEESNNPQEYGSESRFELYELKNGEKHLLKNKDYVSDEDELFGSIKKVFKYDNETGLGSIREYYVDRFIRKIDPQNLFSVYLFQEEKNNPQKFQLAGESLGYATQTFAKSKKIFTKGVQALNSFQMGDKSLSVIQAFCDKFGRIGKDTVKTYLKFVK